MTDGLSICSLSFSQNQLLFGRDEEVAKIRSVYQLVVSSSFEAAGRNRRTAVALSGADGAEETDLAGLRGRHAIALSGPQGAGKTSLLSLLRNHVQKSGHYFCLGSFENHPAAQNRPYFAIVDALGQLAESLLDDDAACSRLRKGLRLDTRRVVTRFVPAMGPVLGIDLVKPTSSVSSSSAGAGDEERRRTRTHPVGVGVGVGEWRRRWYRASRGKGYLSPAEKSLREMEDLEGQGTLSNEAAARTKKDKLHGYEIGRRLSQSLQAEASDTLTSIIIAVQTFFCQLCSGGKTIVMALDNVEGADTNSLKIIESLAAGSDGCPGFLLFCAYRSGDNCPAGLSSLLKKTEESDGVCLHSISIGGLDQVAVNLLLANALKSDPDKTESLAAIVFRKTKGNVTYVVEFTKSLVEKRLMSYSWGKMAWIWDDDDIEALPVAENVSHIFRERLKSLQPEAAQLLSICSCLGATFRQGTVVLVITSLLEYTPRNAVALEFLQHLNLENALSIVNAMLEEGMIERRSELLTFAHQQLQDASFLMIPVEIRSELQYLIGRALVDNFPAKELDEVLFAAVNLLNNGIERGFDLVMLAELNFSAGRKAGRMGAYSIAANHFATCIDCINRHDVSPWSNYYALYEESHQAAAVCEGQNGNYVTMQLYVDAILDHAVNPEDRMEAYCTQTLAHNAKLEAKEGFATVFGAFNEILGEKLPSKPSTFSIIIELIRTKRLLKKFPTDEDILLLPIMKDRTRIFAMKMLKQLVALAWTADPKFYPVILLKMIEWTCRYGLCAYSPGAFSGYGQLLTGVMKDLKGGQRYGELGLSMWEKLKAQNIEGVASEYAYVAMCFGQSASYQLPAASVAKNVRTAYNIGMESGDTCYSFACLNLSLVLLFFSGKSLPLVKSEMERALPQHHFYGQDYAAFRLGCMLQLIVNLKGDPCTDPYSLSGDIIGDEDDILRDQPLSSTKYVLALKQWLAYLFGNYKLAGEISDQIQDFATKYAIGHMLAVRATFFDGLTALELLSTRAASGCAAAQLGSRKWKKRKSKRIKAMKQWVEKGNVNANHMLQLMEAENFALTAHGVDEHVRGKFDQAIKTAAKAGYLQDVALANQRAGMYFLDKDQHWASTYLAKSYELWSEYGAEAIGRCLDTAYPQFISPLTKVRASALSARQLQQSKRGLSDSTLFEEPQFNELTSPENEKNESSSTLLTQSSMRKMSSRKVSGGL